MFLSQIHVVVCVLIQFQIQFHFCVIYSFWIQCLKALINAGANLRAVVVLFAKIHTLTYVFVSHQDPGHLSFGG